MHVSRGMSTINYEAMKAEYTSDPYDIPEKMYAYYNANGYSRVEASSVNSKIEESIYQGGVVERNIPEGKDKKAYKELMELLGSFGFDHNYSIDMKRKLIREIGATVLARIPYPKPFDISFFEDYSKYYQTPGNNGNSSKEYADPNATTPKEGGGRKGSKGRKTRRHRRSHRKTHRVQNRRK